MGPLLGVPGSSVGLGVFEGEFWQYWEGVQISRNSACWRWQPVDKSKGTDYSLQEPS